MNLITTCRVPASRIPVIMVAAALASFAAGDARAGYTSQFKVGNWSGGAWADNTTNEFRNCGLGLKFSSGTELTVILPANFAPSVVILDPRLKLTPQQRFDATIGFDPGAAQTTGALALGPTMVQLNLPVFPNNYDMVRKASRLSFTVPGLSSTLDISGMQLVMAKLYECVVAERGKMNILPAPLGSDTPQDKAEVFAVTVAVAEKAAINQYTVLSDKDRPPAFEKALVVWGHMNVPGADGISHVLGHAYWYPPLQGQTIAAMRDARKANLNRVCADASSQTIDLPPIPGKPTAVGIGVLCKGNYEEIYIVPRKNGGHFEISFATPPARRKTLEPIGAKYRAAIGAVIP